MTRIVCNDCKMGVKLACGQNKNIICNDQVEFAANDIKQTIILLTFGKGRDRIRKINTFCGSNLKDQI